MTVFVLTLNWEGADKLKTLTPGLIRNLEKTGQDWQWFIRDNGSAKDDSKKWLDEQEKNGICKVLHIDHNRDNFSQGVNSLFELAKPNNDDLILLLNNDIIFNDILSLNNMIKLMNKTNVAVVGAKLLYENGKISHNGIVFSKQYGNLCWNYRSGEMPIEYDNKNRYFQAVTAACSFVKVENFVKAGMMPDQLIWSFDDVWLNLEISINQKEKIACCGETNITHITSHSLKKNNINKLFLQRNVKTFKDKWFGKYEIDHEKYLNNKDYKIIC